MNEPTLKLRRLGWAGVEMDYDGETLLIDYLQNTESLVQLRSAEEFFPPSSKPGQAIGALVTHLHPDHADPKALHEALLPGALVLRPEPAKGTAADLALTMETEKHFIDHRLAVKLMKPWDAQKIGPFEITAVPAVCGFGDPQVSWVVQCEGTTIFHAGDTLFHGNWWRIANCFGPPDIAFLPINGPLIDFPILQPASSMEAVMTPEQAAVAANILQAKCSVPIHYEAMHKPPIYIETPNALARFIKQSNHTNTHFTLKEPGDWFKLK